MAADPASSPSLVHYLPIITTGLSLAFGSVLLRRYRELKAQHPEDERPMKYLHQIGTILSFYALKKDVTTEVKEKMPTSMKVVVGMIVVAGIALILILLQLTK